MLKAFENIDFILASGSPRRRQLLLELGIDFRMAKADCEEMCPLDLQGEQIPMYLSALKADAVKEALTPRSLLITADTIVWAQGKALGKPSNRQSAIEMLQLLSGRTHQVITGVTLKNSLRRKTFCAVTEVTFIKLTEEEICYYVDTYKPFDKAGAYGIQEWIGLMGVESINGCFYNVMGLPVPLLYKEIKDWIAQM